MKEVIGDQKGVEGPATFKFNGEDKWALLLDGYTGSNAGEGFFPLIAENPDDLEQGNFNRLEDTEYRMPTGAKHGSILPVTQEEYDAIMEKWGNELVQPVAPDVGEKITPDLEYMFDESLKGDTVINTGVSGEENNGTLHNAAEYVKDPEKGKVLSLGGGNPETESPYLEFPRGYFDGKDNVSIFMDIKSEMENEFFFTFGVGQDTQKYLFLRTRSNEVYSALTVKSNPKEQMIEKKLDGSIKGKWTNIGIVLERNESERHSTMKLYKDGELIGENNQLVANMSTMGPNLKAYLGKAFYNDPYFEGDFDNVRVYNRALSDQQVEKMLSGDGVYDPNPNIDVTGVSLNLTETNLIVGEELQLEAVVTPSEAMNKDILWSSSDEKVITVDKLGQVIAIKPGIATITATTVAGNFTAVSEITVSRDKEGEDSDENDENSGEEDEYLGESDENPGEEYDESGENSGKIDGAATGGDMALNDDEKSPTESEEKKENKLPVTATNLYNYLLLGIGLLAIGLAITIIIKRKNHNNI